MKFDVCIVGAGLSGLACARKLIEKCAEISIVLLEARDRVGCRTLSVAYDDDALDLGGQWVGPTQHRTLRLIQDLKLQTKRQVWFGGGRDAPPSGGNYNSGSSVPLTEAETREFESITNLINNLSATFRNTLSWTSPRAASWDKLSVTEFLNSHVTLPAVRRELELLIRTVTASEPSQLSFLYFLTFIGRCGSLTDVADGDGGAQSFKIPGGAQQISLRLAAQLQLRGVRIALCNPVSKVSRAPDGLLTLTLSSPGAAPITASKLVLAMPPPLWTTIQWSPPLPAAKRETSTRMFMGAAVKTIAVFKDPFWDGCVPQGQLEDLGPIANLFPSTVAGRPALIGLATATAAAPLVRMSEEQRRDVVLQQYARYFGSDKALTAVSFFSKDWVSEPFSRGCYAALMPPGLASGAGQAAAWPVDDVIFFCGTELATEWPGYFEGAIEAGYRAAEEVAAALDGCGRAGGAVIRSRL